MTILRANRLLIGFPAIWNMMLLELVDTPLDLPCAPSVEFQVELCVAIP